MNNCVLCGKETKNRKYCSISCATQINNKTVVRKRMGPQGKCSKCNEIVPKTRKYCKECFKQYCPRLDYSIVTIADCQAKHKHQHYNRIRDVARTIYKREISKCQVCKYSKHIEICHIKPISSYPKETTVSEVNSRENILFLCPNCHWEFDHGLLKVDPEGTAPHSPR